MSNIAFYTPDKNKIFQEEFVAIYSEEYFLPRKGEKRCIPNLRRSSRWVEDQICDILRKGIQSPEEFVKVLAWKIGKIKHKESESSFSFVKGWNNWTKDSLIVKRYDYQLKENSDWDLGELAKHIIHLQKHSRDSSAQSLFIKMNEWLDEKKFKGIGSVYLITLLFFLTHGDYPIYDRFAMKAVLAIKDGKKPGEQVTIRDLPDRHSNLLDNKSSNYYVYKEILEKIFGTNYKNNRKIDQALWAYGHLF